MRQYSAGAQTDNSSDISRDLMEEVVMGEGMYLNVGVLVGEGMYLNEGVLMGEGMFKLVAPCQLLNLE